MRFILLSLLSLSLLHSLSTLPYIQLSSELYDAKERLTYMQNVKQIQQVSTRYIEESQDVKKLEKYILQDGDVTKNEAGLYLKALRRLDSTYEGVLLIARSSLKSAMKENDYETFLTIVNSDLPRFFDKSSLQNDATTYYEANKKNRKNMAMERELQDVKSKRLAQKLQAEEEEALHKAQQELIVKILGNSKISLNQNKQTIPIVQENAFTRWMPQKEYQAQYNNGHYQRTNTYPIYIEVDSKGNRRVIPVQRESKVLWSTTSGRLYKDFKKISLKHKMKGKALLSRSVQKIDGMNVYSGVWVEEAYFNREANKLASLGLSTP